MLVLNTIVVIAVFVQIDWLDGVATAKGAGFTVTVAVIGVPGHPAPLVGVMVKVTVTAEPVILVNVPEILPEPLAGIPVTLMVLSLVHE